MHESPRLSTKIYIYIYILHKSLFLYYDLVWIRVNEDTNKISQERLDKTPSIFNGHNSQGHIFYEKLSCHNDIYVQHSST